MEENLENPVRQVIKYWWVPLLTGAIAIILGIWCIGKPQETITLLTILFIAGFLASGICEIIFAIINKNQLDGWGWNLVSGIISLILGIILVASPITSIFVLIFYVGFWIVFETITALVSAIQLQRAGVPNAWLLIAFAVLGLILGFIVVINPVYISEFIVLFFSFGLILYGVSRIYYATKLKSIKKYMK